MNFRSQLARVALAFALMFAPTLAVGQIFYCTFDGVFSLSAEGEIEESVFANPAREYPAVVDTAKGTIVHPLFGNQSYPEIFLIDAGSSHSPFKVVALSPEGSRPEDSVDHFRNMTVFQIDTYREGQSKTFLAFEGSHFGYGICK